MGVSNVLGWQPAGSLEKSTHCSATSVRLAATSDSVKAARHPRTKSRIFI